MTNPTIKGINIPSLTDETISFDTNSIDKTKEQHRLLSHIRRLYTLKDEVLLFRNHTRNYVRMSISSFLNILEINHFKLMLVKGYGINGDIPFTLITVSLKGDETGETSMLSIPQFVGGHFKLGSTFIIKESDWDLYRQDIAEKVRQGRKNDEEDDEEEEEEPQGETKKKTRRGGKKKKKKKDDEEEGDVDCKGF